jgi:hypothetical protein
MAPKKIACKAKAKTAKAKVTAKAKAKAAVITESAPDELDVAEEPDAKRRQLARRDSDAQALRAREGKLNHVPESVLSNARSSDGLSINQYIKDALKNNSSHNKRLGSEFWVQLNMVFSLFPNPADALKEPGSDDESEIDSQLVDMLMHAHSDNPATRKAGPLLRYLDHCVPLSRKNLYGMLQLVSESPTLTRTIAVQCQVGVLKYFARTCVRKRSIHTYIAQTWHKS